jgi:hypothetical protein
MTQLVVSVRNAHEAALAVEVGVDVIDVKEPSRGSLGAAERHVVEQIFTAVAGRWPVSVALGELLEAGQVNDDQSAWPGPIIAEEVPAGACWAKYGLAHCSCQPGWQQRWRHLTARLPAGVQPVPVVYADHPQAHAPAADVVLQLALETCAPLVLVDTCDKSGGGLLTYWSLAQIEAFCRQARRCGVQVALAGSLRASELEVVLPLQPGFVAIRGAACGGERQGNLEARKTMRLVEMVRSKVGGISEDEKGFVRQILE